MSLSNRLLTDHPIIHASAAVSGVVGATSPVTGPDAVLIMPIQMTMAAGLAVSRGRVLSNAVLESAGVALAGQILGKGTALLLTSWMPGIGGLVRAGVAMTVTEGLGWALVDAYDQQTAPEEALGT